MKKILLLSFVLTSVFANAQVLQNEDFNLAIGNVGTDFTGATAGKGGLFTAASNGTAPTTTTNADNANFQIVANGNGSSNGVMIQSPNGNKGARYMWKDGLSTAWAARTTGNDILEVEVDLYTGPATTSTSFTGVYLYDDQFNVLNGLIYTNNTRLLRGIARLNNAGTVDSYTVGLATAPGLILTANTWYRIGFGYNTVTGEPTWRINTMTQTASIAQTYWADPGFPFEVDMASEAATTNTTTNTMVFDNFVVRASATDTLGVIDAPATGNDFGVYPNPTSSLITISNASNLIEGISITDLNGRVVRTIKGNNNVDMQVNIGDLSAGMYLMTVDTNNGSIVKKIVKQ